MSEHLKNCLLCDVTVYDDCKYSIFQTHAPHSGSLVINLLINILPHSNLEADSSFLCKLCYALIEKFDYFLCSTNEIKRQILTYLQSRFNVDVSLNKKVVSTATQTDDDLNNCGNNGSENLIIKLEDTSHTVNNRDECMYCCNLCSDQFKSATEFKRHFRKHDTKTFDCKFCHNLFASKAGLLRHITRKHKRAKNASIERLIEPSDVLECNIKIETQDLENEAPTNGVSDLFDGNDNATSESGCEELYAIETLHSLTQENSESSHKYEIRKRSISSSDSDDSKPLTLRRDEFKFEKEWTLDDSESADITTFSVSLPTKKGRGRPKKNTEPDAITVKPYIFQCPQCPKKWRTKSELRIHLVSHSDVRAHVCDICGQAYKKRAALDIHLGMHNGINPYTCPTCGKVFTQKGALNRHLPIHTGEANYQCDLCGKRFIHHTSFSMHALTHSGLKAYKCEICGLGLMSTSHLKRHMRAHSGEKKYGCSQCGKRFAERYNLAAHERLHFSSDGTRKRTQQCPLCGDTFQRRQKLEEHLANNHNKISDTDETRKWTGAVLAGSHSWTSFPTNFRDNATESTSA